ncbi:MAG: hypothetical protein IGS03_00060 [Candidatus Sericytochromatia bacterium]|nr:hypothetical protein [Candidatus Sericytochromatia bacterium]
MEIPGMNPLQNRPIVPGQQGQAGVPDLILDGPKGRIPAEAAQQQAAPTQAPYQAPQQAIVQQSAQNMTAALMEMNIPPTPQNLQMAQLLVSYGHAVNSHTMGVVRQAMQGLSDKDPATMEAVLILLTRDLPVNPRTVAAIQQFMNGQPLQQQLQQLPRELGSLLQQMQQTAQGQLPQTAAATQTAAQAAPQTATQTPTAPNTATATPAGQTAQSAATVSTPPGTAPTATATAALPGNPAAAATAALNPAATAAAQQVNPQAAAQTVAQNIQSGQTLVQAAPLAAAAQQFAGQAQALENKSDGLSRIADKSTAQRVNMDQAQQGEVKAVTAINDKASASQSGLVSQHLPSQQRDNESLRQLYLYLQHQDPETLEALKQSLRAPQLQSPQEAALQLIKVLQNLAQLAGHLSENMQLHQFQQLGLQHQQIIQLTGLLEAELKQFHQIFGRAFPSLADRVLQLLQHDSQDMFGRLAQLIDENQAQLKAQGLLPGNSDEQTQLLALLRQLLEQVGLQVEKVQAHLGAREMLSQTLPCHCIPLMVHFKGQAHPAELYIQQDYDPEDPNSGPDPNRPLKVTLTLETHHLGRVAVDLSTLKEDLMLDLKVLTRRVKLAMDERLDQLRHRVENESGYSVSQMHCRVVPDLESRQSMLLPPKRNVYSLRRVEGVV